MYRFVLRRFFYINLDLVQTPLSRVLKVQKDGTVYLVTPKYTVNVDN